jgi:hypothetical protein
MFEYVIAVTPPGGHTKHYHRGTVWCEYEDEADAVKQAIGLVSKVHGLNLNHPYSCVVLQVSERDGG